MFRAELGWNGENQGVLDQGRWDDRELTYSTVPRRLSCAVCRQSSAVASNDIS